MKKLFSYLLFIFILVAGYYVYTHRSELRLPGPLNDVAQEIINNTPLRSLDNYPNAVLTQAGVITNTNKQRASQGLSALKENAKLDHAAQLKVQDMFDRQYFEHVSPTGEGPSALAKKSDYAYIMIGENLALGNFKDDEALVAAWMNSPGHRANILHPQFQEIGVAVGKGTYEGHTVWLAVQEFGKPSSACPSVDIDLKAQIDADQKELDVTNQELQQMRSELDNEPRPQTQEEQDAYNQKVNDYNERVRAYQSRVETHKAMIDRYNVEVRAYNACLG